MSNNNPFLRFLEENNISKSMSKYQENTMDWQALFEMQRRNAHAWSQAGQVTMSNLQNIAQKQRTIASQMVKDSSSLTKEVATTPAEKRIEKNAEIMKNWTEQTAKNMQEMSGMLKKSQEQANKILNNRFSESMDELKSSIKTGSEANKKNTA